MCPNGNGVNFRENGYTILALIPLFLAVIYVFIAIILNNTKIHVNNLDCLYTVKKPNLFVITIFYKIRISCNLV